MQKLDGTLVYSASDLTGFLACEHLTQLEKKAANGLLERPHRKDPLVDLLAEKGLEHEKAFKAALENEGLSVVTIDSPMDKGLSALQAAASRTTSAMRDGADVIYQAVLFDGHWRGYADFLRRVERPSSLGHFSYEVLDTKLARTPKASAVLQLCNYSDQVGRIQELDPEEFRIVLGHGQIQSYAFSDFAAYYRMMRKLFDEAMATDPNTYPDPVDHCKVCRWWTNCNERRRSDDHLTFVAQIRRDQIKKLVDDGLPTLSTLADSQEDRKVPGVAQASFVRLNDQAKMQADKRQSGVSTYKLLDRPGPGYGLERLPEPSTGDIFFDIEADQFAEQEGLEFLFGWMDASTGAPTYRCRWAHSSAAEKQMFEEFIDYTVERRKQYPEMHVYHYAPYEVTAMRRLMGRHATREEELDRLLRGRVFVDLYQVVRQSMRISEESYSIKKLEVFYMGSRTDRITESSSATIEYENYRETGNDQILRDLEEYNEADCVSLVHLQSWLEKLRNEAADKYGEPLSRPDPTTEDQSDAIEAASAEVREAVEGLTDDLPDDPETWNDQQRGKWLLAQLLNWHRREVKSEWWLYFDRLEKTPVELIDDGDCLGGLVYDKPIEDVDRSTIHRLKFPPQEHKITPGDKWIDPTNGKGVHVVAVDNDERHVLIKRGKKRTDHPEAIMPGRPIPDSDLRRALLKVGNGVLNTGLDQDGSHSAARQLILRQPPRIRGRTAGNPLRDEGESSLDAAIRLCLSLEGSYLPIQGPPGTGKSYSGAHMILELVKAGHKVGITATSHKVISNLLKGACKEAQSQGFRLKALQQCPEDETCIHDLVTGVAGPKTFNEAWETGSFDVAAGTAWLWCRDEMEQSVDTLFIDEAGQFSLANAVAVSVAAENLVLLGDPQQLAQPSNGIHPAGAGASVLEHVLDGAMTIDDRLGLFLEKTWRMHPSITEFISTAFYEGRLESEAECEAQALVNVSTFPTQGVYLAPVTHEGNRITSKEEAELVKHVIARLQGKSWTNSKGVTESLQTSDLLVVAPYNAQVSLIRDMLGSSIPVGTVDKFQGQEGAVAIYAMTTSHPEDIPRNFEFLYSHNRLNVAISRARVAGVLICSPQLLRARCRTPEQMRLMNALCVYTEMAKELTPS